MSGSGPFGPQGPVAHREVAPPLAVAHTRRLRIALIGARGVIGTYSGIETYYEEVGARLAARGHDVTAYCRNYFTPEVKSHRGIKLHRLPSLNSKHLETFSHSFLSTLHAVFKDYDIVQYHALGSAPLAVLPRLAGKTTIVSVRGLDWQRGKWSALAQVFLRLGEWASWRIPHATSVVSQTLATHYEKQHGISPVCIENAVEPAEFVPLQRLEDFGIESRKFLLFAGRLSPEKQVHVLLEAAEPLLGHDMKLVIAGDSSHTERYARKLRESAGDHVVFLGKVNRDFMAELYSHCHTFVLPSTMEGRSVALLEALAYGNCLVASDIPENQEVIADAGLSFSLGDVTSLRAALDRVLNENGLWQELRERAAERARAQPGWDEVAARTESFYLSLLDGEHDAPQRTAR